MDNIRSRLVGNRLSVSRFHCWLGLYKVEFRILEIRISGDTNLKKHFLSGNWIRKKIFWAEKTFEFWISADNSLWILAKTFFFFFFFWRSPNFGRKNCLNIGFRPIIHSEFWRRPFFFFFFFFFWRSPNFGRKKLYCRSLPWVILE